MSRAVEQVRKALPLLAAIDASRAAERERCLRLAASQSPGSRAALKRAQELTTQALREAAR